MEINMDSKRLEELYNEYKKIKGYADGGKVETDFEKVLRSIRESFTPPEPPPKEETQEERYERIRKQNRERASGNRPSLQSMDPELRGYAYGSNGPVEPEEIPVDLEGSVISADPRRTMEIPVDVDSAMIEAPYETEGLAAETKTEPTIDKEEVPSEDATKEEPVESASIETTPTEEKTEPEKPSSPETSEEESSPLSRIFSKLKPQSMNVDFGPQQGDIAQELKDAQAQRQQMLMNDQIQKNFNLIGAGINRAKPLPAGYFDSSKMADNAVKNIEEKIALQKHDPNSQISQGMRNWIQQKYGITIGGNPSAADIEGISQPLYKEAVAELKGATQMALANKKYEHQVGAPAAAEGKGVIDAKAEATGKQARQTEESKQKNRMELQHLKGTIAGQMFDLKRGEKVKGASVDFYKDWVHQTGRGQPLGIAARTSIFADKLPALVNQYKDLNEVPETLVVDANTAFGNLISQGVPSVKLLALLDKNNLPREPGRIWTWITANPAGANQKEMLGLLIESANKQKELADAQMKDAAIPLLKAYEHKGMPAEQRKQILERFNANEDEYQKFDKGGKFAKEAVNPSKKSEDSKQGPKEVKRTTKDGRTAIFDADTKKFLRYE